MPVRLDPITLTKPRVWKDGSCKCLMPSWLISWRWQQSKKLITDSMNSSGWTVRSARQQVMPDDHSELVPLLPIPNRTVKRLCADDSAGSRVKVGHRQAIIEKQGLLLVWRRPCVLGGVCRFLTLCKKLLTRSQKLVYTARLRWSQQSKQESKRCLGFLRIIKNIQPISVGVWRRLRNRTRKSSSRKTLNAHENRSEVHFNSVFMSNSRSN